MDGLRFTESQKASLYRATFFWVAVLSTLLFISRHNFQLYHAIADGISIVTAACIFTIVWNARRLIDNDYFLFVGISFLFFAFLDLIHMLGNKGMGAFPAQYGNLGPAFYIISRYFLSISMLLAPLFIKRKLNTTVMFSAYALATALVFLSVFYWHNFPVCIIDGVGLTPFKIDSDYAACLILAGAAVLLLVNRRSFDSRVLRLIVSSVVLSIATGLAFTLYTDPFDFTNVVGHFLQIGSFYLAYLAFVETGVNKPQETLYRKLKQNEEALTEQVGQLAQAKREWERTFDAVPDLIAIMDENHRIRHANRSMAERLKLQPGQCSGELCYKVVHGLDQPPFFCPHALTLADSREHMAEVHEPSLGGDFLVSATPLIDEDGKVIGSVHVARDITKRKQIEEALRERTAELEAANRELESFSYSVSHDLRAPLRTIDGFSKILLRDYNDKLDEDIRRKLTIVRDNTEKMDRLINDLLNLSRLGRQALQPVRLDMTRLFRQAWEELCESAPDRDVRFNLTEVKEAVGDRALIKQVILNILSNAMKYSRDRNPAVIEIGSSNGDQSVVFSVKDNGVGFDMSLYDKLFGVFRRLHSQSEFEGTGVGLALVKRIVERHGGRVWAESEVGKGTIFYFSLPS